MSLHALLRPLTPFTLADARALGVTPSAVRSAVDRGELRRVRRGAFVAACAPDTPALRLAAAQAVLGRACVFSHGTAAHVLAPVLDLPPRLVVTVPPRGPGATPGGVRRVRAPLAPDEVVVVDDLRVTCPKRTVVDVAAGPDLVEAAVAVDAVLAAWPTTRERALALAEALPGHRGIRRARAVLAAAEPLAESPQETRLRLALVAGGLPRPVAQHEVRDAQGRFVARVDLAYPEARFAIEYDGAATHGPGLTADRDRLWRLARVDWSVLHVTASLLRRHDELCARVAEGLAARGWRGSRGG